MIVRAFATGFRTNVSLKLNFSPHLFAGYAQYFDTLLPP